jgi:hypothetical protein
MRKALLLFAVLGLAGSLWAADPEICTWKIIPSKTKATGPAGPQEKSSTVKIEPQGDGIKFIWDAINAEGKAIHGEFVGKYDGKDYPVTGGPGVDTVAMKKIDPNTADYLWKESGKKILSERYVISKDGKTATLTARGKNAQGQNYTVVIFWEKQ